MPWKLSSGEQHKKTPTHGLCACLTTHTRTYTLTMGGLGRARVLCTHPTVPAATPGPCSAGAPFPGAAVDRSPLPTRRGGWETSMGAENGGQSAQGPGLQKGSPERSWGVGCPRGVGAGGAGGTGGLLSVLGWVGRLLGALPLPRAEGSDTPHQECWRLRGACPSSLCQRWVWAGLLLSTAGPVQTDAPQAEGAVGPREGTSQALRAATPHPLLPAWGADHT